MTRSLGVRCPHAKCGEISSSFAQLNHHWNDTHFKIQRLSKHASKLNATVCPSCESFIGPDDRHRCPRLQLKCPHSACYHRANLNNLNKHWASAHSSTPKSESHASQLSVGLCHHCSTFQGFSTGTPGALRRHTGCPNQRQPSTPTSKRDFAQETEALRVAQHSTGVQTILSQEDVPVTPQVRQQRGSWKVRWKQFFADFEVASTQKDTTRMDALLKVILQSPLVPFHSRKPSISNSRHAKAHIRRSIGILQGSGRVGKAMGALRSDELFQISPSSEGLLRNLYPTRIVDLEIPDDVFSNDHYKIELDRMVVRQVLSGKDRTTGRGPSNISYGDLQLFLGDDTFLNNLCVLLEDILNGRIPMDSGSMKLLLRARGVALKKPNGKPRPIGVREVLINLALSSVVKQFEQDIKQCLGLDDYGYKVKDGAALPAIKATVLLKQAEADGVQRVCFKLDIKNAYGSTQRNSVLKILLEKLPRMVRPFLVTHQGAHEVCFPNMAPILAAEGLTQGDPAAPVYAQLVYGGICQRVRNQLDPKLLASFFDDTFIVDDFDLALEGVLQLKQLFQEVGLEVCLDKSSIYSTTPLTEAQRAELAPHGIRDAGEGILLLGTPIGSMTLFVSILRRKPAT